MDYEETMTLIDALNDKLRQVNPSWYEWDFLPHDWGHIFLLARALDIDVPEGAPLGIVQPTHRIKAILARRRLVIASKLTNDYAYVMGQINALEWVLGERKILEISGG